MKNSELIKAIVLKCETEIAGHLDPASAGTLADEILSMIEKSESEEQKAKSIEFKDLAMDKPLVICDLETNGKEVAEARITEFAGLKIYPDGKHEYMSMLIWPGAPVTPEIEELTGITNDMLITAQPFDAHAVYIHEFLKSCYFMGYGGRNFDAPVLWEEFNRLKINFELDQDSILDPLEIFQAQEPRTLTGAARFYLDLDHEGAHRAMPDVEMTAKVIRAQLAKYHDLPRDLPSLIQATKRDRRVDMAGKIALNDDGVPCYTFGDSTKGKPVISNAHFAEWMLGKAFSQQTKMVVRRILNNR